MRRLALRIVAALAAAFALSGCQPGDNSPTLAAPAEAPPTLSSLRPYEVGNTSIDDGTCNVEARTIWQDAELGRYHLEARSVGVACSGAKISLAIRAPNNAVIMRSNFAAASIDGFDRAQDPERMRSALIRWMTNDGRSGQTTAFLPDWIEAQFSRLVLDERVTEESYRALRAAARPMLCFADSLTTKRCVSLSTDGMKLERVGQIDLTRG